MHVYYILLPVLKSNKGIKKTVSKAGKRSCYVQKRNVAGVVMFRICFHFKRKTSCIQNKQMCENIYVISA